MEKNKPEVWEKKEDFIREQLIGIGIFCLGLFMALPAIFNCN